MEEFILKRDRDAWATIRGYVYQVNLTISEWLRIEEHQMLELERGEDIDIISNALRESDEEQQRILGQVKHREKNLTLRAPEASEAIATFYEHIVENPQHNLLFRFITNADVVAERPSPFEDKSPAIHVWERIKTESLEQLQTRQLLKILRGIMSTASIPHALSEETWGQWIEFVQNSSNEELQNFIRKFTWSTKQVPFDQSQKAIKDQLVQQGLSAGLAEAERLYDKLFLYVFKILSSSGVKRITKSDLLIQISQQTLAEDDCLLLIKLQQVFSELEERVESLEQKVDIQKLGLEVLGEKFEELKTEIDFHASVDLVRDTPVLDVPCFNEIVQRTETVRELIKQFDKLTWIGIYGDIGRGKSHLAALVATELGTCRAWVRLRDLNPEEASLRLEAVLAYLSGKQVGNYRTAWYETVCSSLPQGTLIILDDLPRSTGGHLEESLIMLVRACHKYGHRLLSTSNFQTTPAIKSSLSTHFVEIEVPHFTDQEIVDLLSFHNAPQNVLENEKFISMIAGLTRRHPVLLMAAVQFIINENWDLAGGALIALFEGAYTHQVDDFIQGVLLQSLEESDTRELLYRLTLAKGSFGSAQIKGVSDVAPSILRPFEKVNKALGLWLQKDTAVTYLISPLIMNLGELNLDAETKRHVHAVLGKLVLSKEEIDPFEATTALTHFLRAEDYNSAGMTLLTALIEFEKLELDSDPWGFTYIWRSEELPLQMDHKLKLSIRIKQISLFKKMGIATDGLISDLERLLSQYEDDSSSFVSFLKIYLGSLIALSDPIKANDHISSGLSSLRNNAELLGKVLEDEIDVKPASLMWLTGYAMTSNEQLKNWLDTIAQLPSEQRQAVFEGSIAIEGSMVICDQVWMREVSKVERDRNWDRILTYLQIIEDFGREMNWPILSACAIRGKIIVKSEYQKNITEASSVANNALVSLPDNQLTQFIIRSVMGRQFVYAGRYNEAIDWLTKALQTPINVYLHDQVVSKVELSVAFGDSNPEMALYFTGEGVKTVKESGNNGPVMLFVQAIAEHIIAAWLAGKTNTIFEDFQEVVDRLLKADKSEDSWKKLFMLFGHVSGYIVGETVNGRPPDQIENGEPYAKPVRGMFVRNTPQELAYLYDASRDGMLAQQLANLAESIGMFDQAAKWSLTAFDLAVQRGNRDIKRLAGIFSIPYLIMANRFAEAMDVAIELEMSFELRRRNLEYDSDSSVLGNKPNETWDQIENRAAEMALLPSMMSLVTLEVQDREKARDLIAELASLCRQISIGASEPTLWVEAAEAIEEVFHRDMTYTQFIEKGGSLSRFPIVQLLYYVGAGLVGTPREAFYSYLAIAPFIQRRYQQMEVIYKTIILPYVFDFWYQMFDNNRFQFSAPRLVEEEFKKCLEISENERLEELLKILKLGLGV